MAQLKKERARKPLLDRPSTASGGQKMYEGRLGYVINLYQQHPGHSYELLLSRVEMLGIVQSWMAGEARAAKASERENR